MSAQAQRGCPRAVAAAALVLAVAFASVGCAAETSSPPQGPTTIQGGPPSGGEPLPEGATVPAFEGPFAGVLETAYRESTSVLQRSVLEDGEITELEMSALRDDVVLCLSDGGVAGAGYGSDGSLSARTPEGWADDALHALVADCQETRLGQVDMVYLTVQRDPGNLGEPARMVPCLQGAGLVGPNFTAEDYAREMASGAPSFDVDASSFAACLAGAAAAP